MNETYKITDGKSVEEKIEELKKDDRIKYRTKLYLLHHYTKRYLLRPTMGVRKHRSVFI